MNKKIIFYWAAIEEEKDSDMLNVYFPDIPNAVTFSETMTGAFFMAIDVLSATLADYDKYPEPTPYEKIVSIHSAGAWLAIPVDEELVKEYRKR